MIYFDKEVDVPAIPANIAICPICGASVIIEDIDEWETETGRVTESGFHVNCSTELDFDDDEYDDWFNSHWSMPYVDWLPIEMRVYHWFDKRYRLKENS